MDAVVRCRREALPPAQVDDGKASRRTVERVARVGRQGQSGQGFEWTEGTCRQPDLPARI